MKFKKKEKPWVSRRIRKLIKKMLDKNYFKRINRIDALFELLRIQQKQQKQQ